MALLEKFLFIKKSKLPQAGKGLFTKIDIEKGERIAEYKGKRKKWKHVKHRDGHNPYLMYITRSAVIDSEAVPTALARYVNDARGFTKIAGLNNNCEYVSEGNRCFLEAIRKIKKGDELFAGYGKEFWALQRKLKAAETKKSNTVLKRIKSLRKHVK